MCRTVLSSIGERGDGARIGDDERGDGTAGLKSQEVRSLKMETGPATENILVLLFTSGVFSCRIELVLRANELLHK